jgi:hypothetical protein
VRPAWPKPRQARPFPVTTGAGETGLAEAAPGTTVSGRLRRGLDRVGGGGSGVFFVEGVGDEVEEAG